MMDKIDNQNIYQHCVESLQNFANRAGFSKFVVGLSGGIDCSLVSAICVDAFGSQNLHGVLMPGPYSSASSINDAKKLADNLSIQTSTIPIMPAFNAFEDMLSKACGGSLAGLARENTQARCRMIILMALSNAHGWMLLNTGNRSEAMMGYCTLYGDSAGAFAPIGGLYKTQVYSLANWRNSIELERNGKLIIPVETIQKPPSAELSSGQQDELSFGFSYKQLDIVLKKYFDDNLDVQQIFVDGLQDSDIKNIISKAKGFEYKRKIAPDYPKLSDIQHM